MEEAKLTYEFLFVGKDEDQFVHNYVYESTYETLKTEASEITPRPKEKLFISFGMLGNAVLAEEVGQVVFETMKSGFFSEVRTKTDDQNQTDDDEESDAPYSRFEEALKSVNREIRRLQDEKEFKFQANLHLIIAVVSGSTLYLTQTGEAEAYLLRRKLISVISEGLSSLDSSAEIFVNIASGALEPADILIFSTTRLLRYVAKTQMAKSFDKQTVLESLNDLKSVLETEITQKNVLLAVRIEGVLRNEYANMVPASKFRPIQAILPLKSLMSSLGHVVDRIKLKKDVIRDIASRRRTLLPEQLFHFTKDKILVVIAVLVLVLLVGVYLVRQRGIEQEKFLQLEETLQQVEETVALATTKGNYNKPEAAELLSKAEEQALEVLNTGLLRAQATYLLDQIKAERDRLDNVVRINEPRIIADLSQKRSTVEALGLLSMNGELYVYEYNALYRILLDKVNDPVTIDENQSVVAGAYLEDKNALVFLTQAGNIIEYRDGLFFFMDTADQTWHTGKDIAAYGNRIYILDPASNQIWRYTRKERDSYSSVEGYNSGEDLQNAISMAIDASIYLLNADGSIQKFYSGSKRSFRIDKAPMESPKEPVAIYTDKDVAQFFILDAVTNRIFEYYKEEQGDDVVYSKQYVLSGVGVLKDLYFDKKSQNLYVLDSTKLYQIDTK